MHPTIIQGGMGVGVSGWRLARAVAATGQLGVVSGTAVAVTLARRLADGDVDGQLRAALEAFPVPSVAERIIERYSPAEPGSAQRYRGVPMPRVDSGQHLDELTVAANFVEVHLARQGAIGPVGINLLEKIQLPTLPSLYGAMLAGVDYVLIGAGVPARIPAILDRLADNADVALPIAVADEDKDRRTEATFSPRGFWGGDEPPRFDRPKFLAIVSSATLATFLARNATGAPDGFVIETPVAGGHNAPPRGRLNLDDDGAPIYGDRDRIDFAAIRALDRPFWLAGGYGTPQGLGQAQQEGAVGIQVGTPFAFCQESGVDPAIRRTVLDQVVDGSVRVRTDPVASPTGFPFKIVNVPGTLGTAEVVAGRDRICDLGYLREPYRQPDGRLGYRCASEPVDDYVRKGGNPEDTVGRLCLCNGLVASIGLGQLRGEGIREPALVTAGDGLTELTEYVSATHRRYTAADVVDHLLGAPVAG